MLGPEFWDNSRNLFEDHSYGTSTAIIMWTRSEQVVSGLDSLPAIGSREEHNGEKGGQISRQINLALEELDEKRKIP